MSWTDLVDVAIAATGIALVLTWLRRSGARFALLGVAMVVVLYLVASRLELELTAWLLQGFAAVFLVFLVVVFQDDLRRLFEQLGRLGRRGTGPPPPTVIETLVRALARMAELRIGALIVVPGREPLERLLDGGAALDAWISEPLLLSIFDVHSPGHDGAVIVRGARASRYGVHLPLSTDRDQLAGRGTRHAAALGLAERSDALCIVVSEERGQLSVARDGRVRVLSSPEELQVELRPFLERVSREPIPLRVRLWRHAPVLALSLATALAMWGLLVPGSRVVERWVDVPVRVENLPEGYELVTVEPPDVRVAVQGPRVQIMLADLAQAEVRVDVILAQLGRRTFEVSSEDVVGVHGLAVRRLEPEKIKISLRKL